MDQSARNAGTGVFTAIFVEAFCIGRKEKVRDMGISGICRDRFFPVCFFLHPYTLYLWRRGSRQDPEYPVLFLDFSVHGPGAYGDRPGKRDDGRPFGAGEKRQDR